MSSVFEVEVLYWRQIAERFFAFKPISPAEREELVQETLLRLWCAHKRGAVVCVNYLYATCKSVWYDYLRQCARQVPSVAIEAFTLFPVPEEGYEQVEVKELLKQALSQLSTKERQIVEWHYLEEKSFAEIAGVLGEPTERVKKACQRAIAKLQRWACAETAGGGASKVPLSVPFCGGRALFYMR